MNFINIFTIKLLSYIFIVNFFLTGILYQSIRWIILPLFKSYNLSADITQLYTAIIFIPYSCKPVFGILSDIITIRGYNKKYWILLFVLLSSIFSTLLLVSFNFSKIVNHMVIVILTLIVYNFQIAVTELLTEAVYTSVMKKHPESGSDVILYTNICKNIGQLLALVFLGPLIDKKYYYIIYIIMAISSFTLFFPTLLNWLNEERGNNKYFLFNKELLVTNKKVFTLIFFTGISSLILSIISVFTPIYVTLIISLIVIAVIIYGSWLSFDKNVFYIILYLVIIKVSKPSLGTAMDYFYTADNTCLPNGPHFDFKYYITYTGILGTVITLLSILFYKVLLSKLKYRNVLIITSILISLSGISDLLIVLRINLDWGISDGTFYILGEAILEKTIATLYIICISTLISKNCKDKMESSTYAFLSSVNEFSTFVSKIEGAFIFNLAGIKSIIPCDFSNLWILILCCHIIPPLIIGIPSIFLIPNIYQKDNVDINVNVNENIENTSDIEML